MKGAKGGVVYSKDDYYTTERIVNMDDKAYIGYSPSSLRESADLDSDWFFTSILLVDSDKNCK